MHTLKAPPHNPPGCTHLHEPLHASLQWHCDKLHACTTLLRQQLLVLHLQGQCACIISIRVTRITAGAHRTQVAIRGAAHVLGLYSHNKVTTAHHSLGEYNGRACGILLQ
jgi:hypothetical protein